MAEKTLNVRIQNKISTYAEWQANKTIVLKSGEIGICVIPAETGAVSQEPAVLFKVGDGTKTWEQLSWVSAVAADVYGWAKAATKPTYTASGIKNLDSYISGKVQDTNTKYQILQDENNGRKLTLQSKELNGDWTTVKTFTIPETVYTLAEGTTNGTVKFNGTNVAVHGLGSAAYTNSNAYDSAGTGAAEAKKVKDTVVNSIAATANKGIEIAGTAIAPTIGVKVDPDASNALTVGEAGLKVEIPAAAEYSIVKDQTSTYAATYHLTKGGVNTGVAIDIPKDMVVKSGEVVTNPAGQTAGTYLVLTLANATEDKVYINVGSLIEYVTSGSKDSDQIKINVSSDHKVTATLSNGSVTKAQLVTEVQTSLGKADSALQKSSITTGTTNGTISVGGNSVKVKGLGSAAYTNADAYDEKGAASAVLGTAADGAGTATVYGVKAAIAATNTEVAKKINATEVSAIGKSGNVKDLLQTEGDVLVFNCGTASTVI